MKYLSEEKLNKSLSMMDLSHQSGHVLNLLVNKIKDRLENYYQLPIEVNQGNPIVSVEDNYTLLGYSLDEITLTDRYTRYIDQNTVLRTQMTVLMPSLLRKYKNKPEDKIYLSHGLVYRRDVVDRSHVAEPHQMDIWLLKEGLCSNQDLIKLIKVLINLIEELLGTKLEYRLNKTSHHYTDDGLELEIKYQNEWLELLECGLVAKTLLSRMEIDSNRYSGLALGMGLDRLAMIIKGIDDIRVLRYNDQRIRKQMQNLEAYKKVSNQPKVKRDLSLVLSDGLDIETITELIWDNLAPEEQSLVEEISLVETTPYRDLLEVARKRLGIKKGQSNYLIRVIYRHPTRSISKKESMILTDRLYNMINKII